MTQFLVVDGDGDIVSVYKGEEMDAFQILTADEVRSILSRGGGPKHVFAVTPALPYEYSPLCSCDELCTGKCSRLFHHAGCPALD